MLSRSGVALVVACAVALGGCYLSTGGHPPPPPTTPDEDAGRPPAVVDASTPPLPPVTSDGTFPVAGGTTALTADGRVVAADVQTDTLVLYDPATRGLTGSAVLGEAVDPGRVAVDAAGRAHVLLRATGELATVDLTTFAVSRRAVCGAPRGIAVDGESLWVACAGGELVTLPVAGGAPSATVFVEPDLRDVIVADDVLYVSRFRSAELLTLDRSGSILARRVPETRESAGPMRDPSIGPATLLPNVAHRIRRLPDGRIAMLHQRSVSTPIDVETSGYTGGECGTGVVEAAISMFPAGGGAPISSGALVTSALPVDLAYDPSNDDLVVASAGIPQRLPGSSVARYSLEHIAEPCMHGEGVGDDPAVAIEILPDAGLVTFHHASSALFGFQAAGGGVFSVTPRAVPAGRDRGYVLFHTQTVSGVACASCHPEGGEDGHVWDFTPAGPRRTQTLLGGLLETAPFHWSGDQPDMTAIMEATFTQRMQGFLEGPADVDAISAYLDGQPLPRGSRTDPAAIGRGQALFEGGAGCASCHGGATLTNGETLDVGTGGAFQVPSLRGVWLRAPFFHDGCASTLSDVLSPGCGGASGHGDAAALTAAERDDLIAYLRSL